MYSTQVYIFQQMTRVLMMDTSGGETFTYRYDPVYAKKLTINKGVDNVLLFEFVNQEEKPVNITGSSFVFRAINQPGDKILVEQPLVILNGSTGRAKVTLTSDQLYQIQAQPANYSIQRTQPMGGLTEAVFVNAQAGARAPVDIVDSVLPQFVPSSELTIPTTEITNQGIAGGSGFEDYPGYSNWYWNGNPNGAGWYNSWMNPEFYSSFIEPRGPVTTVQMDLVGYTGTIKAQAAENYQSIWYNATESQTFYNETRTLHWTILGWHPLLRMCFDNNLFSTPDGNPKIPAIAYAVCNEGQITEVVITNNGSGYLAPPHIDFVGNGAGATAEAVINPDSGAITDIVVTNPGSGYWPVPNIGNPNANPSPIPASQQGAIVVISTGYVVNLLYR
jgi:hypothetical protein